MKTDSRINTDMYCEFIEKASLNRNDSLYKKKRIKSYEFSKVMIYDAYEDSAWWKDFIGIEWLAIKRKRFNKTIYAFVLLTNSYITIGREVPEHDIILL